MHCPSAYRRLNIRIYVADFANCWNTEAFQLPGMAKTDRKNSSNAMHYCQPGPDPDRSMRKSRTIKYIGKKEKKTIDGPPCIILSRHVHVHLSLTHDTCHMPHHARSSSSHIKLAPSHHLAVCYTSERNRKRKESKAKAESLHRSRMRGSPWLVGQPHWLVGVPG